MILAAASIRTIVGDRRFPTRLRIRTPIRLRATTPLTICRARAAHVTVDLYAFYARSWLSEASAAASTPGDLFFGGRNFACNEPRATPA